MISAITVLIVFSVLILIHELGHFVMAKRMKVKVEKFSFGFGPKLFSFKGKETEYLICAIPLGGYVKMAGDDPALAREGKDWEYLSKPIIKRFGIVVAGPLTNYLLAFLLFSLIFILGAPTFTTEIGKVIKDFPAYSAGIREADKIVSVNGKEVKYWDDLLSEITKAPSGEPMDVVLLRKDKTIRIRLTPKVITTKNIFNQTIKIGKLGIAPADKIIALKVSPVQAFYLGARKTLAITAFTYKALWHMATGGMPVKESLTGPIGIAAAIGNAAKMGMIYLIDITAQINLAIAIFNLLPFPVLDGGHVLFLLIEKIRKKPLSPKVEQVITQIAISLLIALAVFISWNDIAKFVIR
ncbi:MAG: RIP metalloprotease RseP [Candidatus Omnitrophica bacterium]|nr:RIP metalloprotease RseP [Candidatus Omnitrophota bacterium]